MLSSDCSMLFAVKTGLKNSRFKFIWNQYLECTNSQIKIQYNYREPISKKKNQFMTVSVRCWSETAKIERIHFLVSITDPRKRDNAKEFIEIVHAAITHGALTDPFKYFRDLPMIFSLILIWIRLHYQCISGITISTNNIDRFHRVLTSLIISVNMISQANYWHQYSILLLHSFRNYNFWFVIKPLIIIALNISNQNYVRYYSWQWGKNHQLMIFS